MGPAGLVVWGLVGLAGGWVFHALLNRGTGTPPTVSWAQPLTLLLVAAILWATAWSTRRTVQQRTSRLSPHQFVNRLALARACAYVGALVAGFYFGYAVSWIGVETSDLAGQRVFRSACAGVAGILVVVGGVLLERACRVPQGDDQP
jgi:lysylphosphatidylglycerol synthetase-like protein (DUF2156 family)